MIVNPMISGGVKLPALDDPGTAADLLAGKQLVDQYGKPLTGTMPKKTAADLSASGAAVTVPAGYYPEQVSKSVAAATQATPGISVSSNGLITASATQGAGYVAAGTKSATKQLPTHSGGTYQPRTYTYTAASSGSYLTGNVNVLGDANLVAGNIKKGVSIFGVAGSLEAPETVHFYISNGKANLTAYLPTGAYTILPSHTVGFNLPIGCAIALYMDIAMGYSGHEFFEVLKTVFDYNYTADTTSGAIILEVKSAGGISFFREGLIKSTCTDWRGNFSPHKAKIAGILDVFQDFLTK